MDRRQYLGAAGTALVTTGIAGCLGAGEESADGVFVETDVNGLDLDVERSKIEARRKWEAEYVEDFS